jgi:hypothetical protein
MKNNAKCFQHCEWQFRCCLWRVFLASVWFAFGSLTANRKKWVHPEVSGRVIDALSGQPISGATIKFGGKFSVDTIERINQSMGQHAGEYVDRLPIPDPNAEAEFLVASADCKGVPMVNEDAKKVAAFEHSKKNPGNRRMAAVTSVYTVDPHSRSAEEITSALFREEQDDVSNSDKGRPKPKNKNTTAHMPRLEDEGDGTFLEVTAINMGVAWLAGQVTSRRKPGQKLIVTVHGFQP